MSQELKSQSNEVDPDVIVADSGRPYRSKGAAEMVIQKRKYQGATAVVVPNGWAIQLGSDK